MFCPKCGREVADDAVVCVGCGRPLKECPSCDTGGRDWLTAVLLCLFLGGFGVHRFYTGHTVTGIIQLCTFGGCYIWALIDFVMILTGSFRDSDGRPLVKR